VYHTVSGWPQAAADKEARLAVEIDQEEYSVPWQGVIYEATYSGRRYACIVATHHLKMKKGSDAVAEFRARLPDVERATEQMLRVANSDIDEGRRRAAARIIVPLTS
jgi:hypothetical protein